MRCEAYEALEQVENSQMALVLYKRLKVDRSSTARTYAVIAILMLMKKFGYEDDLVKKLRSSFLRERAKRVNLAYLALFYYMERNIENIYNILVYIDDEDYHVRCNVVNILGLVIDNENAGIVKNAYRKRYEIESTRSVKATLEKYI